jgi:hypothetical protein
MGMGGAHGIGVAGFALTMPYTHHQKEPTWKQLGLQCLTVTASMVLLGLLAYWVTVRVAVPDAFKSVDITALASGR